jgi:uncharacterized protein (TIGR03437 family)
MKFRTLLALSLLACLSACGPTKEDGKSAPGGAPISYEFNRGQADVRYQFVARAAGLTLYLNPNEAVIDVRDWLGYTGSVLRAELVGADPDAKPNLGSTPDTLANFFIGADSSKWLTDVPVYSHVRYRDVYPGIDVDYHGRNGVLEHDFIVAPNADPGRIKMSFHGADGLRVDPDGNLEIAIGGKKISWRKPVLYQETASGRRRVEGAYRLEAEGRAGFSIGAYDRSKPLVIDPVIQYVTYVGRATLDVLTRVGTDAAGNVYLTGSTRDPSFPISPGAYNANPAGASTGNVIVAKLNPEGTGISYITQFGGADRDYGVGLAVDSSGNVYLAGTAESNNFPTTPGALKTTFTSQSANRGHCFVTKLNAAGNALVYSTYLGGRGTDRCYAIALDPAGNAYVTGLTSSTDFPVTENAPQTTYRGSGAPVSLTTGVLPLQPGSDAFVAKLNSAGSAIVYATFFGGSDNDVGTAIAVDPQGNAYIGGVTSSTNFPVSPGAAQSAFGGNQGQAEFQYGDGFVVKLNPAGDRVVYSTYLGGRQTDFLLGLAVDSQGSAYVTGGTTSTNFPTTAGSFQPAYKGLGGETRLPAGDAFVTKLAPNGQSFAFSTFLGGTRDDRAVSIAVDAAGKVWVAGHTLSTDFPTTGDAFQRTHAGQPPNDQLFIGDAFLTQIDAAGALLLSSTFLGGRGGDAAISVSVLPDNSVVVGGLTASDNLPITPGAYQRQAYGPNVDGSPIGDAFVARFADKPQPAIGGFVNAASYSNSASPGMIGVIAGSNLGPDTLTTAQLDANGVLANTLAGTQVFVNDRPAPLVYVSRAQTSFIVPYETAAGVNAQVVVVFKGVRSAPLTIPVVAASPGLFSANSSGTGQGAILNQDNSFNNAQNPAAKGSIVVLFLTGEGQTDPPGTDGQIANNVFPKPALPVRVDIGGRQAEVLYAGAAPGQVAGLMQINAKIPENSNSGPVPVQVTVGTAQSQRALTVAIR